MKTAARSPFNRTIALAIVAVVLFGALFVLNVVSPHIEAQANKKGKATPAAVEAHKQALKSQVDTPGGEPQNGRDPASQQQSSLAQVASTPQGNSNGNRNTKPAAGLTGTESHNHNHSPATKADVYGDPKKTGVNAAGCYVDYGKQGEQCVSVSLAGTDGILTCSEIRTQFATGVTVSGTDRFQLDRNADKVACGTGE